MPDDIYEELNKKYGKTLLLLLVEAVMIYSDITKERARLVEQKMKDEAEVKKDV